MKINLNLLEKYHQGDCTPAELEALKQYFLLEDLEELHLLLANEWEAAKQNPQPSDQAMKAVIWSQIQQQAFDPVKTNVVKLNPSQNRLRWRIAIAFAASLIGLIFVATWMWSTSFRQNELVETYNTSAAAIKVNLVDGSTVWLNRNSKLIYPKRFSDSTRLVKLEGEAYFKVTSDSTQPFLVQAGTVQTRVLGTAFNVQAFTGSGGVKVALVEGKVQVSTKSKVSILSPGELLIFDKGKQTTTIQRYSQDAPYAWRDGIIHFDGAQVHEVSTVLQNWYGIDVILTDTARIHSELVTRLDATRMTMDQILEGIAKVTDYRFERKNRNTLLVKPD